ncbi:hypothetical protein [Microbacterium thalli]|uniref:Uncharacterized protein n=1 Tax=Microbacterium thalli TaxID=3027921 RepID=A0ABT5SEN5_9MICO|nr:hypothetical protein [Microbacterium thalli]MDD7961274.1 hypothetical protein [Microbacterium thalli]
MTQHRILPADRWEPFSDEHLARVVPVATDRIIRASAATDFTPRQAEMVIFDACGMSEDGVRIWHAARRLGESANARARSSARTRFGGRTSSIGWIGWVLVLSALAGSITFAVALQTKDAVLTAVFSAATAMAVLVAAVGARGRPLDRALWRPQAFALGGTAIAVAIVGGGAPAFAMAVLSGAPIIVVTSMVAGMIIRRARPQQAREVDDSLTAAYRAIIHDLPGHVEQLRRETSAALPPERARFVERARAAVFERVLADDRVPERSRRRLARHADVHAAGGVIIADFADPLTWMPATLARSAYTTDDPRHPDNRDG